ncbi:MAG: 30S ribosomal protein S27ae [Candidatus Hadarchaeales archaeon]
MSKKVKARKARLYSVKEGKLQRLKKECPRCGGGVFLAEHEGRISCGKCGYTEFKKAK